MTVCNPANTPSCRYKTLHVLSKLDPVTKVTEVIKYNYYVKFTKYGLYYFNYSNILLRFMIIAKVNKATVFPLQNYI